MADKPCPNCGHCPTCGRSNQPRVVGPYWRWWYPPTYPYQTGDWWTTTISTSSGDTTNVVAVNN